MKYLLIVILLILSNCSVSFKHIDKEGRQFEYVAEVKGTWIGVPYAEAIIKLGKPHKVQFNERGKIYCYLDTAYYNDTIMLYINKSGYIYNQERK